MHALATSSRCRYPGLKKYIGLRGKATVGGVIIISGMTGRIVSQEKNLVDRDSGGASLAASLLTKKPMPTENKKTSVNAFSRASAEISRTTSPCISDETEKSVQHNVADKVEKAYANLRAAGAAKKALVMATLQAAADTLGDVWTSIMV